MQTSESNRLILARFSRKLGDSAILFGIMRSPVWKELLQNFGAAVDQIIWQFFAASAAITSYTYTAIFRTGHGTNVCGLSLTLLGTAFIAIFNSPDVWPVFVPFVSLALPAIFYFEGWGYPELYDAVITTVCTETLIYYNALFIILSLKHTVMSWCGLHRGLNQRGISYLYLLCDHLFSKYVSVKEFFIHFLETLLVIAVGICLIHFKIDPYFGWFLIAAAGHEAIILLKERVLQLNDIPLLKL